MKRLILLFLTLAAIATLSANSVIDVKEPNEAAILPDATLDKVETVVQQCGTNPEGFWTCSITNYDDGMFCWVFAIEGQDTFVSGPDC